MSLNPNYAEGWSNKGFTLHELKRYEEALNPYQRALSLKKNIDWLLGNYLFLKSQIGDWSNWEELCADLSNGLRRGEKIATPFTTLVLIDDEVLHHRAAQIFSEKKFPQNPLLGPISKRVKKEKIKIAYFSGDFREHAVSYLTAELFENHDRDRFEIIGFAWGVDMNDPMTQRLRAAFDKFIDVGDKSDLQIAKIGRKLDIDIAIDLMGYTQDSKTGIFACRVAPVQCSYIGYLGSMGANYFDYIIGDKTLIPHKNRTFFSEKIVYLPCFQSNDSKRPISPTINNREKYGISREEFVFCSFNNSYKIQPTLFQVWMEILKSVDNSVLWLIESSPLFKKNLLIEVERAGVHPKKILFTPQVNRQKYLEQYQAVDLFLDTLPYNAGTTASDALWSGVPVLTQIGNSYSGRMAASLLKMFDLHELIVNSAEQYKNVAIELANQPKRLTNIKSKLIKERFKSPLFNINFFSSNLELAYMKMYDQYHSDSQFEDIDIFPKIKLI